MTIALLAAASLGAAAMAGPRPAAWILAASAWAFALVLPGLPRILALLAAPLALAASVELREPDASALLGGAATVLAVVPLLAGLGPVRVRPRALIVLTLTWLGVLGFFITPPGQILAASDLALGTAVVAAAAVLLALTPIARAQRT